ncbi:MAG: hypothetical protein ACTSQA_01450 [Candidatus Heimdallarchaeaceae archaeon]
MNKKLLTILLSVLLPAFLVGAVVSATTSIGDDITVSSGMRIGTGASGNDVTALADDSLFVEGEVEIDGAAYFDGAVDMDSTLDVAGTTTLSGTVATGLTLSGVNSTAGIAISGDTPKGISITLTDPVGGESGIYVNNTFTAIGAVAHKGINVNLAYTPSETGAACPIGISSKLVLNGGMTYNATSSNYQGLAWGVQGQIDIVSPSVFAGQAATDPGMIIAALRGVITATETGHTFTNGTITSLYAENQMKQDATTGDFRVFLAWLRFQGTTDSAANIDAALYIDSGNAWGNNITVGVDINDSVTGVDIDGATTAIDIGDATTGIALTGTYTSSVIDFNGATSADHVLDFTGITVSGGSGSLVRAGSYSSPIDVGTGGNGLIRMYGETSEASGVYAGTFFLVRTTGAEGVIGDSALVEGSATGESYPSALQGGQFHAGLTAGAKLDGIDAHEGVIGGMYGVWAKVYASETSVADADSRVAALWVDNQMSGTVGGEEYGIFATTGASQPDAFIGFETTSSGWDSLFYFDETAYDQKPVVSGDISGQTKGYYLRVDLNGTMYGIQLYQLP